MSTANESTKKPVKNAKLKESLLKTIDGGKGNSAPAEEAEAANPFEEAGRSEPIIPAEVPAEVAAEVDEALGKAAQESKEKLEVKPSPEKIAPRKKAKNGGGAVSTLALVFSIIAMGGAGYSVWQQQGNGQHLANSLENVDESLGALTSRVDEMHADLSEAGKTISSHGDRLVAVEAQSEAIKLNQAAIDNVAGKLLAHNAKFDEYQSTLDRYGQEYADLKAKYGALSKREKTSKKVVKKKAPVVKEDPSTIEGATLSSLDMWGSTRSAVLRDAEGQWVPLSNGDFYQGWRFVGIDGYEALFKKGSKIRRLTVKE